ncbi:hypothetical protein OS187_07850 [Xanthomonadaceae bacterium JHOS43]|nr:hypothetical protein [Xanthomonadaceae bacterium JHOS43]
MTTSRSPVEPFWNRLPDIARYPFRGGALVSLFVFSLGGLLGLLPGLIGLILGLVVWVASYRYAFEILVRTANGQMDAPEIATHTDSGVVWRFILLWLLYVVLFVACLLIGGIALGTVAMLLLCLLLPGAIISLAMEGSLGKAIDPSTPFAIMSRIGAPYFAAFGLLFVIQISAATASGWLTHFIPAILADLLVMATTLWGLFATFHLMGYLVFQYHEALGFDPGGAHEKPALRTRDTDLMDAVEAKVADGNVDAALAQLTSEMRDRAVPGKTHELYRKLLRSRNDATALLEHAGLYLNLLMLEKQERRALALARESLDLDRTFTPQQSEDGHRLALRGKDLGQTQLAIDLWLAMLKRWPRDRARVDWALAVAPLLVQRDRIPLARQILEYVARDVDAEPKARIEATLAQLPAV